MKDCSGRESFPYGLGALRVGMEGAESPTQKWSVQLRGNVLSFSLVADAASL